MKSLFFAIIRTAIVVGVGVAVSSAVALWIFSGKAPTSIKSFQEVTKDLASFHQIKKQMVERSYVSADNIKDDFDQPAGVNSDTIAAKEAEEQNLAKLNAEIAEATKGVAQEREKLRDQEIMVIKAKMAQLQTQLDRVENQNRALRIKLTLMAKNAKTQNQ